MTNSAPSILLADDNESMCFILRKACEKKGMPHKVCWVKSGDQLLSYLKREEPYTNAEEFPLPSVILLDVRMPGKSTKETLAHLKSDRELCTIPVVLWSNYTAEAFEELEAVAGDNFITKPSGFKELMDLLPKITAKMKPVS